MTVEDPDGRKKLAWINLNVASPPEAQIELRKVLTEREGNELRHVGKSPSFGSYLSTPTCLCWEEPARKQPPSSRRRPTMNAGG